jgi:hypothetical protein
VDDDDDDEIVHEAEALQIEVPSVPSTPSTPCGPVMSHVQVVALLLQILLDRYAKRTARSD